MTPFKIPVFLLIFSLLPLTANAGAPPQFKDYPVSEAFKGPNAPVNLSEPGVREFRTRLKEAAKMKPNFSGHYILTSWGCGTGCVSPWIINAKTGKFVGVPFNVSSSVEDDPNVEHLQFKLDSRLLIINGHLNEAEKGGTYYYKLENEKLVPIP
jgi:hypothetical protein